MDLVITFRALKKQKAKGKRQKKKKEKKKARKVHVGTETNPSVRLVQFPIWRLATWHR